MPVYNAAIFVQHAIDSILSQTFDHFEFIIIDDGSTDSSSKVVDRYKDRRIKTIKNKCNLGVAKTLNKGLEVAQGRYIARMDADDISDKTRFERQITFMDESPDIAISGSWVWSFDEKKKHLLRYPIGKDCVGSFLLLGNPLAHPSVIMRRETLQRENLWYDPECSAAQDYELWSRCWETCDLDNMSVPLVSWRHSKNSVTRSRSGQSHNISLRIAKKMLGKLDIEVDDEKLAFHREVGNGSGVSSLEELSAVSEWLEYLIIKNQRKSVFPASGILKAAAFSWFRVCLNSSGLGLKVVHRYLKSSLRQWYRPGNEEMLYLLANAILKFNKAPTGRLLYGK